MTKEELLDRINTAKATIRNVECLYEEIFDAIYDYINATDRWDLEELFDDYADHERVEDLITKELEEGGFERVYFLLEGVTALRDVYKIDNYGNLEHLDMSDINGLIECIKEAVEENRENDDEEEEDDEE